MKAFGRPDPPTNSRSLSPVYPFWTPHPVRYTPVTYSPTPAVGRFLPSPSTHLPLKRRTEDVSLLQNQVTDLVYEAEKRNKRRENRRLLADFNAVSSLLTPIKQKPSTESTVTPMDKVLGRLEEQQQALMAFLRESEWERRERNTGQERREGERVREKTPTPPRVLHPIEDQYVRLRDNPSEFPRLWRDIGLGVNPSLRPEDDGPLLTIDDKRKILAKMKVKLYERFKNVKTKVGKLRVIGWVVLFPIFAYSSTLKRRRKEKASLTKSMEESIGIFKEVTKQWILKAIRIPLFSIISNPDLDLDILGRSMAPKGLGVEDLRPEGKVLKLQVRVKGMLEALAEQTTVVGMPAPLRTFLEQLISDGAFLPISYLLSFESSRLDRDVFGSLRDQTPIKQELLLSFFLISRVLIKEILLTKDVGGLQSTVTEKTKM